MAQECEGESGLVPDAAESLVDDVLGFLDGVQAEIGQLGALQVAPDLLDRVEVGGVGRERSTTSHFVASLMKACMARLR